MTDYEWSFLYLKRNDRSLISLVELDPFYTCLLIHQQTNPKIFFTFHKVLVIMMVRKRLMTKVFKETNFPI